MTNGTKVTVTERKTVNGVQWGKIDKGWISLDYVKFDTSSNNNGTTGSTENDGSTDSGNNATLQSVTGKVNVSGILCIRSGAGTSYTVVGYYNKDTSVTITEQ